MPLGSLQIKTKWGKSRKRWRKVTPIYSGHYLLQELLAWIETRVTARAHARTRAERESHIVLATGYNWF